MSQPTSSHCRTACGETSVRGGFRTVKKDSKNNGYPEVIPPYVEFRRRGHSVRLPVEANAEKTSGIAEIRPVRFETSRSPRFAAETSFFATIHYPPAGFD